VHAVHDCTLVVPEGKVTGLIGPNGAGKSTAIDLITGFKMPDGGVVRFAGHEIQGWPPHRISRLGLIRTFQLPKEWPGLTVMENMLLAAPENGRDAIWRALFTPAQLRRAEYEDRARARAILEEFGLLSLRDDLAGNLSGGQKRLLEFARVAICRPRMVILDEPMGGVNPVLGARMGDAIASLVASGVTVTIVEHNLPFIERVCDSVIVMALGSVIAAGPFESLRSNRGVIDAYLGEVAAGVGEARPTDARSHPGAGSPRRDGGRLPWGVTGDGDDRRASPRGSPPVPGGPALAVRGLTAGYGGPPIIDGVEIKSEQGQITAIVGPNGAGKSTLLKAIAGVIRPTDGRVLLNGTDVTAQPPERLVRKGIAYVPQVANVFPGLTVRENLEMGGYVRTSGVRERADELCALFPDLKAALNRPARTLSGGQRSMLAMARGLMVDPAVLLLDEPSAGLSPIFQAAVWEQIKKIRDTGVAVVVVEQNTRRTLTHADWAYVMALGKNRLEGTGKDLLHDEEVVNLYIGRLS